MARETALSVTLRTIHEHKHARLLEFALWGVPALLLGALTLWGWLVGAVNDPFALILGIVALCLLGWGLLPHPRPKESAPVRGKRGEIQKKVKEGKSKTKKGSQAKR